MATFAKRFEQLQRKYFGVDAKGRVRDKSHSPTIMTAFDSEVESLAAEQEAVKAERGIQSPGQEQQPQGMELPPVPGVQATYGGQMNTFRSGGKAIVPPTLEEASKITGVTTEPIKPFKRPTFEEASKIVMEATGEVLSRESYDTVFSPPADPTADISFSPETEPAELPEIPEGYDFLADPDELLGDPYKYIHNITGSSVEGFGAVSTTNSYDTNNKRPVKIPFLPQNNSEYQGPSAAFDEDVLVKEQKEQEKQEKQRQENKNITSLHNPNRLDPITVGRDSEVPNLNRSIFDVAKLPGISPITGLPFNLTGDIGADTGIRNVQYNIRSSPKERAGGYTGKPIRNVNAESAGITGDPKVKPETNWFQDNGDLVMAGASGIAPLIANITNKNNIEDPKRIDPYRYTPSIKSTWFDSRAQEVNLLNAAASANHNITNSGGDFDSMLKGFKTINEGVGASMGSIMQEGQKLNMTEQARIDSILSDAGKYNASMESQADVDLATRQDNVDTTRRGYVSAIGENVGGIFSDMSSSLLATKLGKLKEKINRLDNSTTK